MDYREKYEKLLGEVNGAIDYCTFNPGGSGTSQFLKEVLQIILKNAEVDIKDSEKMSEGIKKHEKKYPIEIHFLEEEEGPGYYFAFLPDFGHSACSATGETAEEALENLRAVEKEVIKYYEETGKQIPKPSSSLSPRIIEMI